MEESVFDEMVARYSPVTPAEKKKARHKAMQELILVGLYKSGFFDKAAFCGDACLCLLHDLQRFSRDLDFSLLRADADFHMEDYLNAIRTEFRMFGQRLIIEREEEKNHSSVESSFLKEDTAVYNLSFSNSRQMSLRLELDTQPPGVFITKNKRLYLPIPFMARCYTLPDLYAGKMLILLFRQRQYFARGRDWYDFEWFVQNGVMLNFNHLQQRAEQLNLNLIQPKDFTPDRFKTLLRERILDTDVGSIRREVSPLLKNQVETVVWNTEYFLQLVDMIRFRFK